MTTKLPPDTDKAFQALLPFSEAIRLYNEDRDAYRDLLNLNLKYFWEGGEFPSGMVLRHPLMYIMFPEPPDQLNTRYALKVEMVAKALAEGNINGALLWFEKPWRLDILDQIWRARGRTTVSLTGMPAPVALGHVPIEDWRESLMDYWMLTEVPSQIPRRQLVRMFEQAGWCTDVTDGDVPSPRPDIPLTLYRGVHLKRLAKGLSWTTDPSKAEWFARRFEHGGHVYETTVQPEHLLARLTARGESEYVVNTIKHKGPIKLVGSYPKKRHE